MKITPDAARRYLLLAAFMLALPSISSLYGGATGKLLIATERVADGPFKESVVYIYKHDFFWAHGFIVNKPLDEISDESYPVYYGGPVSYDDYKEIVRFYPGGRAYLKEKKKLGDPEEIIEIRGYSGWGLFQLNLELLRNGWLVLDFDKSLVFETAPEVMWGRAMSKYRSEHPPEPGDKIL